MSYVSPLYAKERIIDESNRGRFAPSTDVLIDGMIRKRGLELPPPEERAAARLRLTGLMKPYDGPVYSREVIREKIKEREQRGVILSQIIRQKNIPPSDQNSTNYCWTYGVVSNVVAQRAWRNLPYEEYSRESVAATIKGGSNSGGWGIQAIEFMSTNGIMLQSQWARWSRTLSQGSAEEKEEAKQRRITEFLVLQDRNFLQMLSVMVHDNAVAVGYNWWSHEVCALDPVIIGSSDLGIRIWNSWGPDYGDNGMNILAESKATADDAVVAVVQAI